MNVLATAGQGDAHHPRLRGSQVSFYGAIAIATYDKFAARNSSTITVKLTPLTPSSGRTSWSPKGANYLAVGQASAILSSSAMLVLNSVQQAGTALPPEAIYHQHARVQESFGIKACS